MQITLFCVSDEYFSKVHRSKSSPQGASSGRYGRPLRSGAYWEVIEWEECLQGDHQVLVCQPHSASWLEM